MNYLIFQPLDEALEDMYCSNEFSVIHVRNSKEESLVSSEFQGLSEHLDFVLDDSYDFSIYDADRIIRFCERQFDIDNVYVVFDKENDIAGNIASTIKYCYNVYTNVYEFYAKEEGDYIPFGEWRLIGDYFLNMNIVQKLKNKYREIHNSLLHTLSPMEYCKEILSTIKHDIVDVIKEQNIDGYSPYNMFVNRQCDVYLKNGGYYVLSLETMLNEVVLPDMDDIEYVSFMGVPEFANSSSFKNVDDYSDECNFGIYDFYGSNYCFNSEKGICRVKKYKTPEKYLLYKNNDYRLIQRFRYFESDHYFPEESDIIKGKKDAEKYLVEKYTELGMNMSYKPRHQKNNNHLLFDNSGYDEDYLNMCMSALKYYEYSLLNGGHCENLTIVKEMFNDEYLDEYIYNQTPEEDDENELKTYENAHKFNKLWNISEYVPSSDTDPLNIICLAVYCLIKTVRECKTDTNIYDKCLEKAFELTEGNIELCNVVIIAGGLAGAYDYEKYSEE